MRLDLNHELFRPGTKGANLALKVSLAILVALSVGAILVTNWDALFKTDAERYQAALSAGRLDEAVGVALEMTQEDPSSDEALRALAAAYLQKAIRGQDSLDSLDSGLAAAREAERINPQNPENIYILGLAFELKGDLKGAEEEYLDAIEADPKNAAYMAQLGAVYERMRRSSAALGMYRRAVVADPESGQARVYYGRFLLAQDDYAGALQQVSRVTDSSEAVFAAEANRIVSASLLATGKIAEARPPAERALELAPESAPVLANYAELLLAELFSSSGGKNFDETLAEVRTLADKAAAIDPSSATASFLGYRAAYSQKDKVAAGEYSRQTLRLLSADASLSIADKNKIQLVLKNAPPTR